MTTIIMCAKKTTLQLSSKIMNKSIPSLMH